MKKRYESPMIETIQYSAHDITSVDIKSSLNIDSPGTGKPLSVDFGTLHE